MRTLIIRPLSAFAIAATILVFALPGLDSTTFEPSEARIDVNDGQGAKRRFGSECQWARAVSTFLPPSVTASEAPVRS